jgi:hypothetical protein
VEGKIQDYLIASQRQFGRSGIEAAQSRKQRARSKEEALSMDKHSYGLGTKEPAERDKEPEVFDLGETLKRVDRTLETFFQIHGPVIKDQGYNA